MTDAQSLVEQSTELFHRLDDWLKPHGWLARNALRDYAESIKSSIFALIAEAQPSQPAEPVAWRGITNNGTVIWSDYKPAADYGYKWMPLYATRQPTSTKETP